MGLSGPQHSLKTAGHPRGGVSADPSNQEKREGSTDESATRSPRVSTFRGRGFRGGFMWVDALVGVAVVGIGLCLMLPVLGQVKDDARETSCLDRLRAINVAAQAYATDHNEKFFYHWPSTINPQGKTDMEGLGFWNDNKRLGVYMDTPETIALDMLGGEETALTWVVGNRVQCPADKAAQRRSYSMNRWATGITLDVSEVQRYRTYQGGSLFDRNSNCLNKLILFHEGLPKLRFRDSWIPLWTTGYFNQAQAGPLEFQTPGELFGANPVVTPRKNYPFDNWVSWVVDYGRHGNKPNSMQPKGEANFSFSDGSCATITSRKLYDAQIGTSSDNYLWSLVN